MQVAWNKATSFSLAGYVLAGVIAWMYVGWYWVYLPGSLIALLVGYAVSTRLGKIAARNSNLLTCSLAGVGVAVATLAAGVLALGVANVFLVWLDGATSAGWGLGPLSSVTGAFKGYVFKPLLTVFLFGGWIAVVLGLIYGVSLYLTRKSELSRALGPHISNIV